MNNTIIENEIYENTRGGFFTKMMCTDTTVSHNKMWGNGQGGVILRCPKAKTHNIEYNNVSQTVSITASEVLGDVTIS